MISTQILVLLEVESPALIASLLTLARNTRKARMHQIFASAVIVIVMRSHLWSALIVAHFMSLALIALGC